DILSCHAALQDYLQIRESSPLYAEIRGTRRLGVPCFEREAGTLTLNLNDIICETHHIPSLFPLVDPGRRPPRRGSLVERGGERSVPMHELTQLIRQDMKPALGVTEPGAIAFAAATARRHTHGAVQRITLRLNSG